MKQYRQGDVLVVAIKKRQPNGKKRAKNKRVVLAEGEATGHAHAIEGDEISMWDERSGRSHLRLVKPTALKHEEHKTIDLPAGDYIVIRQREFTGMEERRVAD